MLLASNAWGTRRLLYSTQNRYPNNLWAEIVGNCDIQLMLGCTDDVTADYISDRSGEMSIQVDSTMTVKKTVALAQVIPQYRETQGQGRRKLLTVGWECKIEWMWAPVPWTLGAVCNQTF